MSRKVVIFIFRRHAGEADLILPLLYKFKKNKHKIITIFTDKNAFESLQKNQEVYNLWKEISLKFYIRKFYDSIGWKVLNHILSYSIIKNFNLTKKIKNKIDLKQFSVPNFLKKFKISTNEIKAIFIANIHLTIIPNIFKYYNNNIKIIRFPETTMICASKKENPYLQYNSNWNYIHGDVFLFSTKSNKDYFFGFKKEDVKFPIIYINFFRFEKWWVDKISKIRNFKKKNSFFTILVVMRNPDNETLHVESFKETISTIMKVAGEIDDCKIIFKTHPHKGYQKLFLDILSNFNRNLWQIKNNHIFKLSKEVDMCISMITSACFDSIACNTETIEYFNVKKELARTKNLVKCQHMIKTNKDHVKWETIFSAKNFLSTASDYNSLKKLILEIKCKGKNVNNFKYFKKYITKNNNPTSKVYKELVKML